MSMANRYIDYCMSWGPLIYGYQDRRCRRRLFQEALGRGWSYGDLPSPTRLNWPSSITSSIPWVQKNTLRELRNRSRHGCAQSQLVQRLGRSKILKFDGCYHGHADSMLLVRAGSGLAEMASPDSAGVSASVACETVVVPLNDLASVEAGIPEASGNRHRRRHRRACARPITGSFSIPNDDFLKRLC